MKKRILCKAAAAVFYLMLPWMALTCQAGENVISEGVFINGVDVSGMTAAEAETVVQQQVQALSDSVITLTMDEDQESRTWGELGLQWKNTDLITEISHLGTTGNIVQRYKEQKDLQNQNIQFEIEYTIDEDALRSFVEGMSAYNSEPVEGSVYMGDDGLLYVEGGTDGLTLDVDATLTDLEEYIEGWTAGDTVPRRGARPRRGESAGACSVWYETGVSVGSAAEAHGDVAADGIGVQRELALGLSYG